MISETFFGHTDGLGDIKIELNIYVRSDTKDYWRIVWRYYIVDVSTKLQYNLS